MQLGAVLYIYKGEYGLPTIDFECMRALCLVKFTRFPAEIDTNGNPMRSGVGKLPYLQVGINKFHGYRQIKEFLDNESYPVDRNIHGKRRFLSNTYSTWVFNQLHSYYNYFMFCEPTNYEATRTLYAKRTIFPLNFYYPTKYAREARDVVLTMNGFDVLEKVNKEEIDILVDQAKMCINQLSKRLGKQVWFLSNYYSEVDVTVYSYLSLLYYTELPNNPLKMHIKGCKNLTNFLSRITRDIFRQEAFSSMKTSKASATDPMLTATERHFLESENKTKLVAGLGAFVAMSAFAAWRGLYKQLSMTKTVYGYEFDEDDEDDDIDPDL